MTTTIPRAPRSRGSDGLPFTETNPCAAFYEKLDELCEAAETTLRGVARKIGAKENTVQGWRRHLRPLDELTVRMIELAVGAEEGTLQRLMPPGEMEWRRGAGRRAANTDEGRRRMSEGSKERERENFAQRHMAIRESLAPLPQKLGDGTVDKEWSLGDLARESGVGADVVSTCYYNGSTPSPEHLRLLEHALGMDDETLETTGLASERKRRLGQHLTEHWENERKKHGTKAKRRDAILRGDYAGGTSWEDRRHHKKEGEPGIPMGFGASLRKHARYLAFALLGGLWGWGPGPERRELSKGRRDAFVCAYAACGTIGSRKASRRPKGDNQFHDECLDQWMREGGYIKAFDRGLARMGAPPSALHRNLAFWLLHDVAGIRFEKIVSDHNEGKYTGGDPLVDADWVDLSQVVRGVARVRERQPEGWGQLISVSTLPPEEGEEDHRDALRSLAGRLSVHKVVRLADRKSADPASKFQSKPEIAAYVAKVGRQRPVESWEDLQGYRDLTSEQIAELQLRIADTQIASLVGPAMLAAGFHSIHDFAKHIGVPTHTAQTFILAKRYRPRYLHRNPDRPRYLIDKHARAFGRFLEPSADDARLDVISEELQAMVRDDSWRDSAGMNCVDDSKLRPHRLAQSLATQLRAEGFPHLTAAERAWKLPRQSLSPLLYGDPYRVFGSTVERLANVLRTSVEDVRSMFAETRERRLQEQEHELRELRTEAEAKHAELESLDQEIAARSAQRRRRGS